MNQVRTLFTDNGEPWAVFVLGHVALGSVFSDAEQDRIANAHGMSREELFTPNAAQLFHLRRRDNQRNCDFWQQCPSDAPGAVAVTGIILG